MTHHQGDPFAAAPHPFAAAPQPVDAPAAIRREASTPAEPVLGAPPRPRRAGMIVAAVIGIALGGAALLFVLVYLLSFLGPELLVFSAALALVPLAIVLLGIRWIDRWEPEPRGALVFCFLWGAGVSVLIALMVDYELQAVLAGAGGDPAVYEFAAATVQAPIVEEVGKGLGVLLVFLFARRHFDGPVDGIAYAAAVAAGFAFTENIQYFGVTLVETGGSIPAVQELFVVRGLMSPFAHVMFTACTGILLGVAARVTNRVVGVLWFLLGLVPAILLHAFWNGALFFVYDFYGYYVLVQVPLFLLGVGLVMALRRQEATLTRARLAEYAQAGWIAPAEVAALATPAGRRVALAWAHRHGVAGPMRRYIRDATRLAFARQRIVSGRGAIGARADEGALLDSITASRRALRASAPPGQVT